MLILTVLMVISAVIQQSTGINLTYIVKKEKDKLQPSCIAEENERYSAIGWVYPLPEKEEFLPNITTKFIPTLENSYNCRFSKNDKCNKVWTIKNWDVDENSTRTFDLIFDRRWEDFPTIFTNSGGKDFKEWIEIPNSFKVGFSLRATENVELLICVGWNPYNHPCYHLNIMKTSVYLRKYMALPKNISESDKYLDSYTAFTNILSDDEWRNFVINFDDNGVLSLIDVSVNRTAIEYRDEEPLKPLFLLMRSTSPALWKIHQNHFIYTKSKQISRLGPLLNLNSENMCISLFVSTCSTCTMSFFTMNNGVRKVLKDSVASTKENDWTFVKLKREKMEEDKVNIFVETFSDEITNKTEGFWAIDDVRVCHENEVKVTFLKLKNKIDEGSADDISCQVVQHPNWRPKKLVYPKIDDFPVVEDVSNSTSISLTWTQEDPDNKINYFITYSANDICESAPFNEQRSKSSGFLMTKHNEITIENLVPYTKYNITFSSMLHEKDKKIFVTTLESDAPMLDELPTRLQIQVFESKAYVSWDKIDCRSIYGHIIYSMQLSNNVLNTTKSLSVQTETSVEINDLDPFTSYTLKIQTARNFENIENNSRIIPMSVNFTTHPALAPPVNNLEIYSVDDKSISLRYDLPKKSNGIPVAIQVSRCNPILFKRCKSSISPIKRCALWPRKNCLEVDNLISYQRQTFKVNLKNDLTPSFGEEVSVDAFTADQVPGAPTNLTYKLVDCKEALDYCHLNVSWLHPYNQNGTITAFHIILNGTEGNSTSESIQEVMKISNKTYLPVYEFQVKYIPYSTNYELYVQSSNTKYKSGFAQTHVKTDNVGDHIDQKPKLVGKSSNSVIFRVPPVDRRLKKYELTIMIQDFNRNISIPDSIMKMQKVSDHLCHNFGETWILEKLEVADNSTKNVTIGKNEGKNKDLKGGTQYCITFIVTNTYKGAQHEVVYYEKLETPEGQSATTAGSNGYNHLYVLLLLLLLIPLGFLIYRYVIKKRRRPKKQEAKENVYESLPFEECEESNCVSNETYDHLLHK